jgi:hypothetical protein
MTAALTTSVWDVVEKVRSKYSLGTMKADVIAFGKFHFTELPLSRSSCASDAGSEAGRESLSSLLWSDKVASCCLSYTNLSS